MECNILKFICSLFICDKYCAFNAVYFLNQVIKIKGSLHTESWSLNIKQNYHIDGYRCECFCQNHRLMLLIPTLEMVQFMKLNIWVIKYFTYIMHIFLIIIFSWKLECSICYYKSEKIDSKHLILNFKYSMFRWVSSCKIKVTTSIKDTCFINRN